jgi:hypothetical protein
MAGGAASLLLYALTAACAQCMTTSYWQTSQQQASTLWQLLQWRMTACMTTTVQRRPLSGHCVWHVVCCGSMTQHAVLPVTG